MKIDSSLNKLILELYSKYNRGERIKSNELTNVYNKVTGKNVQNTSCGSCLRQRLFELVALIDKRKEFSPKLTDEDREFLEWTLTLEKDHYPSFDKITEIYNRVFNQDKAISNCLKCNQQMLAQLIELL